MNSDRLPEIALALTLISASLQGFFAHEFARRHFQQALDIDIEFGDRYS